MRILVLSDIHANIDALNSVLKDAKNKYDILISLGDIIGYGPCPNECVEIIAERAEVNLAGNHDLGVCGKININDFSPRAKYSQNWTSGTINDSSLKYLNSLPPTASYKDILLSHGSPENPVWGYILSEPEAILSFSSGHFPLCFFGHTHVPSAFSTVSAEDLKTPIKIQFGKANLKLQTNNISQRMLINPGSVGFPRSKTHENDENNLYGYAQYALFDLESGNWQFKQVRYDMTKTRQLMAQNGLQ